LRAGFRAALGAPSIAMAATFLGFGAAVAAAGLGLGWGLAAGAFVYGMPGQLILLAGVTAGGSIWPAVASAVAANARFLPMAVSLAPWLGGGRARWLALPFIAVTPWAGGMRALPGLPPEERLRWFMGFALGCWGTALLACAAGFALAPALPAWLLALLVFSNPLYFGLLLAMDRANPTTRRAVLGGALASPLVLVLPAAWGLLAAGLLGGTLAILWGARR
jgi:predicted branched-subunit amino acid permease